MRVSLYCGLSSKAVFATKCLKRSQASRQARPRKKWSKDVRKIHGRVVKIRVYCWLRSLCKRYHFLTVLIIPSIKLPIQMRGKGSCVIPVHYILWLFGAKKATRDTHPFYFCNLSCQALHLQEYKWNIKCRTVCANPICITVICPITPTFTDFITVVEVAHELFRYLVYLLKLVHLHMTWLSFALETLGKSGPFSGSLVELVTFWWLVKTTSAIGQADIGH